jgi:hypothetical protein
MFTLPPTTCSGVLLIYSRLQLLHDGAHLTAGNPGVDELLLTGPFVSISRCTHYSFNFVLIHKRN